jgi:hypothetical protein
MEEEVPHGANATFEFRVSPTQFRQTEVFELVIDGCAWLPGTSFETPSTREEYFLNSEREDPTRSRFSAEIVHSACKFDHPEGVVIVARNTGSVIWTQDTPVHVATSKPRDRESALFHQSWVARNRAACFVESEVPPGADATFKFGVSPLEMPQTEVFELVAEGYRWLPGTSFEISPPTQEFVSESECQPRVSAGDFLRRLFWSRAS